MKLFQTFTQTSFITGDEKQYGKFNMFTFPAPTLEEAKTMSRNETARIIATSGNTDKVIHMHVDGHEVSSDHLAVVFWSMVDGQRQKFLSDVIIRFAKMGEDVEQLRSVVEGAIQEYEDDAGIMEAWNNND